MVWTPYPLVIFHVILFTKIIERRDWLDDVRLFFRRNFKVFLNQIHGISWLIVFMPGLCYKHPFFICSARTLLELTPLAVILDNVRLWLTL